MKKSKFLKPFSFASLALLMGIAGTMAFAPLGASASVANASELEITTTTETGGLIVPKKDDPVIYTTESGLEIKWGNALPSTYNNSLSSGNLAGFPYFTTTVNSTTYTWVIIGRNSNVSAFNYNNMASLLFSTWKTNSTGYTYETSTNDGVYFFKNVYESTTPAGSAINGVSPSKSYVVDGSPLVANAEIPSGCVLCLLNSPTSATTWASSNMSTVMYISNTSNYVNQKLRSFDSNDTFGFGTLLSKVQSTTVNQHSRYRTSSGSTGANTSVSFKFFPLGTGDTKTYEGSQWGPVAASTVENFVLYNYLTASQYATTYKTWSRGSPHCDSAYMFDTDGNFFGYLYDDINGTNIYTKTGYLRPACVLKIT